MRAASFGFVNGLKSSVGRACMRAASFGSSISPPRCLPSYPLGSCPLGT